MPTDKFLHAEEDRNKAIREIGSGTPVDEQLINIYEGEVERRLDRDAVSYTIGILEEACSAIDKPFDKQQWLQTLINHPTYITQMQDELMGDMSEPEPNATHREKLLAQSLGEVLVWAGVIRPDLELTGPELLMAAKTLTESAPPHQQKEQAGAKTTTMPNNNAQHKDDDRTDAIKNLNLGASTLEILEGLYGRELQRAIDRDHAAYVCDVLEEACLVADKPVNKQEWLSYLHSQQVLDGRFDHEFIRHDTAEAKIALFTLLSCDIEPQQQAIQEMWADDPLSMERLVSALEEHAPIKTFTPTPISPAQQRRISDAGMNLQDEYTRRGFSVTYAESQSGIYTGNILQKTADHAIQQTGTRLAVIHKLSDIIEPDSPHLAGNCRLQYANGYALVTPSRWLRETTANQAPVQPSSASTQPGPADPQNPEHQQIHIALHERLALKTPLGNGPNFQVFTPLAHNHIGLPYIGPLVLETPNYFVQQVHPKGDLQRFLIHEKAQIANHSDLPHNISQSLELSTTSPIPYSLKYTDGHLTTISRLAPQSTRESLKDSYADNGYNIVSPDRTSGIYTGPVVHKTAELSVQQVGKNQLAFHSNQDFIEPQAPPTIDGNTYTISYSQGKASAKPNNSRQFERGNANEK